MCRLTLEIESVVKTFTRTAFVLTAIVLMAGCGNSSETSEISNPTSNNSELIDPSGILANLTFSSAEDDASYQCLLSETTASATSHNLSALPVIYEGGPIGHGANATWCKTVGCSAMVDADLSSCQHYLTDTLHAPGTEALQIFTKIQSAGDPVHSYGLKSIVIPLAEITGFKVDYERGKRDNQVYYVLAFTPFDGNELDCENKVAIGSNYVYVDTENDINEGYKPGNSIAEQLNQLSTSSTQFKTTVVESLEALREVVSRYIDNNSTMDDATKESAMATANMEINRRIEFINTHGETLYRLAIEQFSITNGCL
jgi:hypothetical protein